MFRQRPRLEHERLLLSPDHGGTQLYCTSRKRAEVGNNHAAVFIQPDGSVYVVCVRMKTSSNVR